MNKTHGSILALLLVIPTLSHSQTLTPPNVREVNCADESLRHALKTVEPGTTVIAKGQCDGPVEIAQDDTTLDGYGAIITGRGDEPAVLIWGARNVKLEGVYVTGGDGHGIMVYRSSVAMVNPTATGVGGSGIYASGAGGGGLSTLVEACNCQCSGNGEYGFLLDADAGLIINCNNNHFDDNGLGGLRVSDGASMTIEDAQVFASINTTGFGIVITGPPSILEVIDSIVHATSNSIGVSVLNQGELELSGDTEFYARYNKTIGTEVQGSGLIVLEGEAHLESTPQKGDGVDVSVDLAWSVLCDDNATVMWWSYNGPDEGIADCN